jgi:cytosine/adenosine deaminase-related metal-dependent hydrolase
MAMTNVAKMFHLDSIIGSIEPGKRADIVILKPRTPNTPVNYQTIYSHLVNTFSSRDVDTVIVNGELVLRDGKLVKVDEEKAVDYVHSAVERFWDRLLSEGSPQVNYVK